MAQKSNGKSTEDLLKETRAKLQMKLSVALEEYKAFWTEKKFSEKLEKATRLFITEKKIKAQAEIKKSPAKKKPVQKPKAKKKIARKAT